LWYGGRDVFESVSDDVPEGAGSRGGGDSFFPITTPIPLLLLFFSFLFRMSDFPLSLSRVVRAGVYFATDGSQQQRAKYQWEQEWRGSGGWTIGTECEQPELLVVRGVSDGFGERAGVGRIVE